MKKLRSLFLAFVLVLTLGACSIVPAEAAQTSIAVQVPDAINLAIGVGIAALLTAGFVYLQRKLGLDLRQFATPLSVSVSAWVVSELQNIINTIPEMYDPTLNLILKLIVVIVAPVGALFLLSKNNAASRPGESLL